MNNPHLVTRLRWPFLAMIGIFVGLGGCASQSPSFASNAVGTLGASAQVLGDLAFLFK